MPRFPQPTGTDGKTLLPWALDVLDVGGEIRSRYVRLQAWVAGLMDA